MAAHTPAPAMMRSSKNNRLKVGKFHGKLENEVHPFDPAKQDVQTINPNRWMNPSSDTAVTLLNKIREDSKLVGMWIAENMDANSENPDWVLGIIRAFTWKKGMAQLSVEFPGHIHRAEITYSDCDVNVFNKDNSMIISPNKYGCFGASSNRVNQSQQKKVLIAIFPQNLLYYVEEDPAQRSKTSTSAVSLDFSHREEMLNAAQIELKEAQDVLAGAIEEFNGMKVRNATNEDQSIVDLKKKLAVSFARTKHQKESIQKLQGDLHAKNKEHIATLSAKEAELEEQLKESDAFYREQEERQKQDTKESKEANDSEVATLEAKINELRVTLAKTTAANKESESQLHQVKEGIKEKDAKWLRDEIVPLKQKIEESKESEKRHLKELEDLTASEESRSNEVNKHLKMHNEQLLESQKRGDMLQESLDRTTRSLAELREKHEDMKANGTLGLDTKEHATKEVGRDPGLAAQSAYLAELRKKHEDMKANGTLGLDNKEHAIKEVGSAPGLAAQSAYGRQTGLVSGRVGLSAHRHNKPNSRQSEYTNETPCKQPMGSTDFQNDITDKVMSSFA
jgi:uncharacterized protein YbjQ (UPF0145 family)